MKTSKIRMLTATAMLAAIATGLMFVDFSVPFMPFFIKLDISELPALIAGFAYGPISGICVCLIKNLFNLLRTSTGGIGELCNFLLGVFLVVPASLIYKYRKNRSGAVIGSLIGALSMAVVSLPLNCFVTYPIYSNFLPIEAIVGMYNEIVTNFFHSSGKLNGLFSCLLIFNVPFTFLKGLIDALICFLIYKPLSPILHGNSSDSHYYINRRNIEKCFIFSVITLGIYGIYWQYLLVKNTRFINNDKSHCTLEMFCLVFVPFYSLYWWYTRGKCLKTEFSKRGYLVCGNELLYLALAFLGLSIVSQAIMQRDFNSLPSEINIDMTDAESISE